MVLAAAIAAGSAIYGISAQKKGQKGVLKRIGKAEDELDALDPRLAALFGRAHKESAAGTSKALGALAGAPALATAAIGANAKQRQGSVLGGVLNRGFGASSSVMRAGQRGVDTQEGAAIAGAMVPIQMAVARTAQQGGFNLADITQRQYGAEADLATNKANLQLGIGSSFDSGIYEGLGAMASWLQGTGLNEGLTSWLGSLFNNTSTDGSTFGSGLDLPDNQ